MFATFILGLVAGVAAPYAEPYVRSGLEAAAMAKTSLSEAELRSMALVVCLLVAAILGQLLFSGGAISLLIGAALGVFGPRIISRFKTE